jgi:hypothetical protein
MAKGQARSTKEKRKPKQDKKAKGPAVSAIPSTSGSKLGGKK